MSCQKKAKTFTKGRINDGRPDISKGTIPMVLHVTVTVMAKHIEKPRRRLREQRQLFLLMCQHQTTVGEDDSPIIVMNGYD